VQDSLSALTAFFRVATQEFGYEIVLNDFCGLIREEPRLEPLLTEFYIHQNPYCMHLKSRRDVWDECILMKGALVARCEREEQPFYGMCWCGREELIFPIIVDGVVSAALSVGGFERRGELSEFRRRKTASRYGFDDAMLRRLGDAAITADDSDAPSIQSLFGLAVRELERLYSDVMARRGIGASIAGHYSTRQYIVAHAVAFIRSHYREHIDAGAVARFCHCSVSTLSHLFKRSTGMSIREFLNTMRIEQACDLLARSNQPITAIALEIGFADSNYFSRVFRRIRGVSPSQYRTRVSKDGDLFPS
jgi:AraC-like DNA-binding protein